MKGITQETVASYLASRVASKRPVPKGTAQGRLLHEFSSASLRRALKDGGKHIDMAWIVRKLLETLNIAEKASERVLVLDRIKDLMLLGAIQDPEIIQALRDKGIKVQVSDPFAGERPKLKLTGG